MNNNDKFDNTLLPLISSSKLCEDYYEFNFAIEPDMTWQPGEYAIFTLNNKQITEKNKRVFSFASIPEEGILKIATKIIETPSQFKQVLKKMKPADQIQVKGPMGKMHLPKDNSSTILIAGGIGITPFRAFFKELEKSNTKKINLIYSCQGTFIFANEFQKIVAKDKNITLNLVSDREKFNNAVKASVKTNGPEAKYFISGSPSMITAIETNLQTQGIPKENIKADSFIGY